MNDATTFTQPKLHRQINERVKESLLGYLLILPSVLVIGVFGLFPIFYSIYMSTFNWRVTKGAFTGWENYTKLFGEPRGLLIFAAGIVLLVLAFFFWKSAFTTNKKIQRILKIVAAMLLIAFGVAFSTGWNSFTGTGDANFFKSLTITLYYSMLTVPTQLLIGLVLAYILFQNIKGKEVFRMFYFLPYVTPAVSTAVVFRIIFSPRETSLANILLSNLGLQPLDWLYEPNSFINMLFGSNLEGFIAGPSLALITIAIYGVWTFAGYDAVIYLAGLGSISKEIYEAAEIDGSNGWHLFWHITFPLISPVSFYLLLISFIGTFKAFNHLYVMRVPSAQNSVITASLNIFDTFYKANNFGYAATQAIVLFIIIAGLTFAQNKLLGKKVFYG
ncbi:MAG: sugar ABC transporter permease [Anaerolineae bacterium]|nr:sugar ABC transporter permease [Anaerolineae bacterium]